MSCILTDKISEVAYLALTSEDGNVVWRGDVGGEEWKISADYNGIKEEFIIRVKRRDPEVCEWLNV